MPLNEKRMKVQTGFSENKGKGTWNGHISIYWPDRPPEHFYWPGEPPFTSAQQATEWADQEVRNLSEKISKNIRKKNLTIV